MAGRALLAAVLGLIAASIAAPGAAAIELSERDRADLVRIEDYLNDIRSMQSRFLQVSPDGRFASGTIYLSRPGRLRVQYDPPVPILMVTTPIWLIFYDSEIGQVSYLPLGSTPAEFLVRDEVRFEDEVEVVALARSPGTIRVTLADESGLGSGEITLTFSDQPLELKKWTIRDSEDEITHVALVDPIFGIPLDPDLFKFVDPTPDRNKDR